MERLQEEERKVAALSPQEQRGGGWGAEDARPGTRRTDTASWGPRRAVYQGPCAHDGPEGVGGKSEGSGLTGRGNGP